MLPLGGAGVLPVCGPSAGGGQARACVRVAVSKITQAAGSRTTGPGGLRHKRGLALEAMTAFRLTSASL